MSAIAIVLIGLMLVYVGFTDRLGPALDKLKERPKGSKDIPLGKYVMSGAIAVIPAYILQETGREDWAWRYVILIITMMVVVNYNLLSGLGISIPSSKDTSPEYPTGDILPPVV